ncbi:MAG: hypothetical protein K8S97_02420 [Anaerolineae bacterium]|nr:hypothetical protein [Anaerolineae bacterium]
MMQRPLVRLLFAFVLLTSLSMGITGITVSHAQQPPPLTQTFTWQPYGLSVQYPADWVVAQGDSAISISPANRDVGDGFGPELVLFDQPNTLETEFEAAIATFAASSGATHQITERSTVGDVRMVRAALTWVSPAASGEILLLAAKNTTALGAAYIVRDTDATAYRTTLAVMFDTVTLGATNRGPITISAGVASVQVPQAFVWDDAGLVLYFPDDWDVDIATDADGNYNVVAAPNALDLSHYMQATTFDNLPVELGLTLLMDLVLADFGDPLDFAETTIAGYDAMIIDVRNAEELARILIIDLADGETLAVCLFAAEEPDWEVFRPQVSAMINEIERY